MTIEQIQHLLAYLGYYTLKVDGLTGPGTEKAIREFQSDFGGLEVDGVAGAATQKALKYAIAYGMEKNTAQEDSSAPEQEVPTEYAAEYLQADGCYHIPRGVQVQLSKNLMSSEIMCQGGGR